MEFIDVKTINRIFDNIKFLSFIRSGNKLSFAKQARLIENHFHVYIWNGFSEYFSQFIFSNQAKHFFSKKIS